MTIGRRFLIIDSELAYSATKAGVLSDALTGLGIAMAITSPLSDDPNVVSILPKPIECAMPKMRERFDAGEHWRRSGKRRGPRAR